MPMALLLNGKAYSIVTDQLGTPTEAYNAEGEEVWRRRLDMNGKILEEVYTETPPTAIVSASLSFSKGSTTTTRRSWHTTDSDTTPPSKDNTSHKTQLDSLVGCIFH